LDTIGPLNGSQQSAPIEDFNTGRVTTQWEASYVLSIPSSWTSGVYLAKLINANGYESYIVFVVRDDGRSAQFLVQIPVTTCQAYNAYPSGGIGKSLYDYNSSPSITVNSRHN